MNIQNIDPTTKGLLAQCQAEQKLRNMAETIKFLLEYYYATKLIKR